MFKSIIERRCTETWRIARRVLTTVRPVPVCVCVCVCVCAGARSSHIPGIWELMTFFWELSFLLIALRCCLWGRTPSIYLGRSIPVTSRHLCLQYVCECMCAPRLPLCAFCVRVHIRDWSQLPSSSSVSFTFGVIVSWGQDPSWHSHLELNLNGQRPL